MVLMELSFAGDQSELIGALLLLSGLALIPFLYQSGPAALFREFIDTALERPMSPTDRAEILSWRSGHHISVGELHAARRYLTEAIREVGWRGKARIQGRIWHLMSRMAWNRKPNGRRLFAHTLEVMQEAGDAFGHALTASEFAQRTLSAALEAPNESAVAEALQCYEHAQLACAQMSSPYLDAHLSWCISYVDRLDGRLEDARQRLLDLRDTYIALSSPMNAWSVEFSLAYLAWWSRGDYARMSEHMLGAQRLAAGFGSTHLTLRTAAVLYEAGPSPHARKWLEQSLRDTLGADIADRVRIRAQARLALCNIELGETTEAIQTLERCLQRSMRTGHIPLEDEVSLGLGLALQVTGAWKRAGAVFAARRHDDSEEMMKQRLLCEVLTAAGDFATGGTAPTPCWRAVASRAHGLGEGRLLGVVQTFLRAVGEPLLHEPLPDVSPRGAILPHERRLGAMVAERVRALTEEDRLSLNPVVSHTRESVI